MNDMTPFDYAGVPVEHAQEVRDAATRIKCRMARTALDIVEIGRELIEVKAVLGHGNFLPWIQAEFGMAYRTAKRFMEVAEALGEKSATLANLTPSALYALAEPSTTEDVRAEVVDRAARGEKVAASDVKELKAKLAERDDKLRTLKTQKQSADAHNNKLVDEVRSKTNECQRLSESVAHLQEEIRRLNEPGTITLAASGPSADEQRQDLSIDITPWKSCTEVLWASAPEEARRWIVDYIAERSE